MRESERGRTRAKALRKTPTRAETLLWSRLRRGGVPGLRFRRQHPVGPYVADFACVAVRLIVEVDGETHHTPHQIAHDAAREWILRNAGWRVLRVTNRDVFDRLDDVLAMIAAEAPPSGSRRSPPPP